MWSDKELSKIASFIESDNKLEEFCSSIDLGIFQS